MNRLSAQIKFEDDEAHPYGTAVIGRKTLDSWARMAETTEKARDRWHTIAHVFAAIIVGLLIALMYAATRATLPAPIPTERASMSLDPSVIRAAREHAVEI